MDSEAKDVMRGGWRRRLGSGHGGSLSGSWSLSQERMACPWDRNGGTASSGWHLRSWEVQKRLDDGRIVPSRQRRKLLEWLRRGKMASWAGQKGHQVPAAGGGGLDH